MIYPPGYFLQAVREHDWPPGFESRICGDGGRSHLATMNARLARWQAAADGRGWAAGTVPMPRTPTHSLPEWQSRSES